MAFFVERYLDGQYLHVVTGEWALKDEFEAGYDGSDEKTAKGAVSMEKEGQLITRRGGTYSPDACTVERRTYDR